MKINLNVTNFNIEKFRDMLYVLNQNTNEMRLIQNDDFFDTESNEVTIIFKTDCDVNIGKFKLIVNFIQKNKHKTTIETTTDYLYTIKQTKPSYIDSTTIYYKTSKHNSDHFQKSTTNYMTNKQTQSQTELSTNANTFRNTTTCSNTTKKLFGKGNIYSPNYPNYYNNYFPINSFCKWLLKSSEGKRFKLSIDFKMNYNDNDYILLYNGSTVQSKTLFAALHVQEKKN